MYKYPGNTSKKNLDLNSKLKIFQIYKNLKYPSVKIDSYFQVYEEIFKNQRTFSTGNLNNRQSFRPTNFHRPKSFPTFVDEKIIHFRGFCYDLEIRETSKNTIREKLQAPTNDHHKQFVDFFNISSDLTKFQQLVQIFTV